MAFMSVQVNYGLTYGVSFSYTFEVCEAFVDFRQVLVEGIFKYYFPIISLSLGKQLKKRSRFKKTNGGGEAENKQQGKGE